MFNVIMQTMLQLERIDYIKSWHIICDIIK